VLLGFFVTGLAAALAAGAGGVEGSVGLAGSVAAGASALGTAAGAWDFSAAGVPVVRKRRCIDLGRISKGYFPEAKRSDYIFCAFGCRRKRIVL
jgi:hypothetical protein